MKDRYGRTIDHIRISVTDRCDLRCLYCMPDGEPEHAPREEILSYEEIAWVVRRLVNDFALKRVRITGGEPLVRPKLHVLVGMLSTLGLEDIAITTNGQLLARNIEALRDAGLNRVNVSLDSLRTETFRAMTGGDLARTLEGIEALDRSGLRPVKINTVVLRGHNDGEVDSIAAWAVERGYEIRFLELMAIGCVQNYHPAMFVPTAEVRNRLRARFDLTPVDTEEGSTARLWRMRAPSGREGTVGFISPETEPFCYGCRRLRMTAKGTFLGCLMLDDGPSVRDALRADGGPDARAFDEAVMTAVGMKPIHRIYVTNGHMMSIGG